MGTALRLAHESAQASPGGVAPPPPSRDRAVADTPRSYVPKGSGVPHGHARRCYKLTTRVEPSNTGGRPLPTWTITHADGRTEAIEADYCQRSRTGWEWWTVVVVIDDPRWCCIRRVGSGDVASVSEALGDTPVPRGLGH